MNTSATKSRNVLYALVATMSLLLAVWLLSGTQFVQAQVVERVQQALQSSTSNSFSYQGYLDDSGNPANGSYDFEFALFDAASGGNQIGSTQAETLVVSDGVFMVELNNSDAFGTNVFDGSDLYLEIKIYDTNSNSFVTLTPRQGLTAVPYAHFAKKVEPLDNVINVAKSGGDFTTITDALNAITDASATNPYLIRIAPGIYDETITLKSHVDVEGSGEGVTIIRHTGGASFPTTTGAGATLLAQGNIVAEIRSLTVESIGTSYATAIWTRDIVGQTLKFKHVTVISSTTGPISTAVLNYESAPSFLHVTITATGGTSITYGVYNVENSAPYLTHATISANGEQFTYAVHVASGSNLTASNTTAVGSNGLRAYGIHIFNASATLNDIIAMANDATDDNIGISKFNSTSVMNNITATATGDGVANRAFDHHRSNLNATNMVVSATGNAGINTGIDVSSEGDFIITDVQTSASGGQYNNGIYISAAVSTVNITNVNATASGGTRSIGIFNTVSAVLKNVTAKGYGGTENYGLYHSNVVTSPVVQIDHSTFSGSTAAIRNYFNFTTSIGASKLDGAVSSGAGSPICVGSYDGSYTALDNQCQ